MIQRADNRRRRSNVLRRAAGLSKAVTGALASLWRSNGTAAADKTHAETLMRIKCKSLGQSFPSGETSAVGTNSFPTGHDSYFSEHQRQPPPDPNTKTFGENSVQNASKS